VWVAGGNYSKENFKSKLNRKEIKEKMTMRRGTFAAREPKE
jgi:hypothetical protein